MTAVLSARLQRIAEDTRAIAELRARSMAESQVLHEEVLIRHQFDLAVTRKTDPSAYGRYETYSEWSKTAPALLDSPVIGSDARVAEFLEKLAPAAVPKQKLSEVTKALTLLAQDASIKDQSKFLFGFSKEVVELVRKSEAEAESARDATEAISQGAGSGGAATDPVANSAPSDDPPPPPPAS